MQIFGANQAVGGFGAGIAQELSRQFPDGFAIVSYAVCGSDLHTQWMPDKQEGFYRQHFEPFVTQGLDKIEQASLRKPKIVGMLWHQGESNSESAAEVEAYGRLMPMVIGNFQETYGEIPFVLGEIREFADQPNRAEINQQMHILAKQSNSVSVVRLQDVAWESPTNVHFSLNGAHEAGRRLVNAWSRPSPQ